MFVDVKIDKFANGIRYMLPKYGEKTIVANNPGLHCGNANIGVNLVFNVFLVCFLGEKYI